MCPRVTPGPLLFINSQDSIPGHVQTDAIRSHVHGRYRRWHKVRRLHGATAGESLPIRSTRSNKTRSDDKHSKTDAQVAIPRNEKQMQRHYQAILPSADEQFMGSFRLDPFQSYPVQATAVVNQTVDYFSQVWALQKPNIYQFKGPGNDLINILFPFALQHDFLFDALITAVRASLLVIMQKSAIDDRAFLHHRGKALSKFASRATSSKAFCDNASILTAAILSTADFVAKDWESMGVHAEAFEYMLKERGSLNDGSAVSEFINLNIEGYRGLAAFGKAKISTANENQSTLTLEYPVPPFPLELQRRLEALPEGFRNMIYTGYISYPVIDLLLMGVKAAGYDKKASEQERTQELTRVMSSMALMAPLPLTSTEQAASLGVACYCWSLPNDGSLTPALRPAVQYAINEANAIRNETVHLSVPERAIFIWSSFAISSAADKVGDLSAAADAVLDGMIITCPEAREWNTLEERLRDHLWGDGIGRQWRAAWDLAMSRHTSGFIQDGDAPSRSEDAKTQPRLARQRLDSY